jgi:hypothetical protein
LGKASRETGQSRVPAPPASRMGMIGEGMTIGRALPGYVQVKNRLKAVRRA